MRRGAGGRVEVIELMMRVILYASYRATVVLVSRYSVKSVFNLYGFNFRPAIKHATGRRMTLCFVFQLYLGRRSGDRHGGDVFTGPNEFMARNHEGLVPLMKNDSFDYIFFPSQKSTPRLGEAYSRELKELDD